MHQAEMGTVIILRNTARSPARVKMNIHIHTCPLGNCVQALEEKTSSVITFP